MRTRFAPSLLIALLTLSLWSVPAEAGAERDVDGELVVTLNPGRSIDEINARYGTQALERIEGTNIYRVRSPRTRRTLRRMKRDAAVRKAGTNGPVRRHQTSTFPNDLPELLDPSEVPADLYRGQLTSGQLSELGIDAAQALVDSADGVVVAVIDTGIDASHPALAGHLWENATEVPGNGVDDDGDGFVDDTYGYDFLDDDADPSEAAGDGPVAGHGTFIAGLVTLAAPRVKIMPIRVLGADGIGTVFDAAAAINYAARKGARVISMSFGADGTDVPQVLRDAVASAADLGIVMVAAAGNDASGRVAYPASDDEGDVIAVGASLGDRRADFSNFGQRIDISAPGVGLISAMPGTADDGSPRFGRWSGTSFSTAVVSAACAQVLGASNVASAGDVLGRLKNNADYVNPDDRVGNRVNFLESVGSVFEDAGALDVWVAAGMNTGGDQPSTIGYTALRTIGEAERVSAHACGLEPGVMYELDVTARGESVYVGRARADEYGNLSLAASKRPASGDEYVLPVPIATIERVSLENDAGEVCAADVRRDAEGVQVWAGVGLERPADAYLLPDAYGWTWYAVQEGEPQRFSVQVGGLQDDATYVLRVDGGEVERRDIARGGETYLSFDFSSEGAGLPSPISPVTRAGRVELSFYDREGVEHLVMGGDLRGATEKLAHK